MKLSTSNVCHAFDLGPAIGTKINEKDHASFLSDLRSAMETEGRVEFEDGHSFIPLDESRDLVIAGVGKRTSNPDDFVVREHRGVVSAYLKREFAAPVDSLAVIVYTREAYLKDPDLVGDPIKGVKGDPEELQRAKLSDATHFVVAVLAAAGPKSPLTSDRFVKNLAGGNSDFEKYDKETLVKMSQEIRDYHDEWCVVAD